MTRLNVLLLVILLASSLYLVRVSYESRRCVIQEGAHRLAGDKPFGVVAYGYGPVGSYAFAAGADVRRIYDPPPLR